MARATIMKYRRKTMKSKSKGKNLRLKKTLKLKPKRRNGKKTQKCGPRAVNLDPRNCLWLPAGELCECGNQSQLNHFIFLF